ncbi:MAG: hypothetical protein IAF94_25025, partial [Pirellulaceae bacterium]|nr:hypothetical protein [Pirellulaceae bacterium]
YVRLEAVRLLGICPTAVSGQVLREALTDSRALVQEAAEHGLRDMPLEDIADAWPADLAASSALETSTPV